MAYERGTDIGNCPSWCDHRGIMEGCHVSGEFEEYGTCPREYAEQQVGYCNCDIHAGMRKVAEMPEPSFYDRCLRGRSSGEVALEVIETARFNAKIACGKCTRGDVCHECEWFPVGFAISLFDYSNEKER